MCARETLVLHHVDFYFDQHNGVSKSLITHHLGPTIPPGRVPDVLPTCPPAHPLPGPRVRSEALDPQRPTNEVIEELAESGRRVESVLQGIGGLDPSVVRFSSWRWQGGSS